MKIGFYTNSVPFDGSTMYEKGLGGSESSLCYAAMEFANRGHDVTVYTDCGKASQFNGVLYKPLHAGEGPLRSGDWDVFFVYRNWDVLPLLERAKLRILVCHDILTEETKPKLGSSVWAADEIWLLSSFHKKQYLHVQPELEKLIWITPNGVSISEIRSNTRPKEDSLIYASRPERGLGYLLTEIWPRLWRRNPRLRLFIAGYDIEPGRLPPSILSYHLRMKRLAERTPGVTLLGSLSKPSFYRALSASRLYLYPTSYPEVFCINAVEAMAAGTPVITSDAFAMKEYLPPELRIKGTPHIRADYADRFIAVVEDLLNSPAKYEALQKDLMERAEVYDWPKIIDSRLERIQHLFDQRRKANNKRIVDSLLSINDIEGALKIANNGEILLSAKSFLQKEKRRKKISIPRVAGETFLLKELTKSIVGERILIISPRADLLASSLSSKKTLNVTTLIPSYEGDWPGRHLNPKEKFNCLIADCALEIVESYQEALNGWRSLLLPRGKMVIVTARGPWGFGVRQFEQLELESLFRDQDQFHMRYITHQRTNKGEGRGMWVTSFYLSPTLCLFPFGCPDFHVNKTRTRPKSSLAVVMIVKNEEQNLPRCLNSLNSIYDELIICDTGSTDRTVPLCKQYTDKVFNISSDPDGDGLFNFAWARNEAKVKATSDWILYIDADEELHGSENLPKYLSSPLVEGYAIEQRHFAAWGLPKSDLPVRLFKNRPEYSFYGVVHEQVGLSLNKPITPVCFVKDVVIAHHGYMTEVQRTMKLGRNLILLKKDLKRNPRRRIANYLMMRTLLSLEKWQRRLNRGALTPLGKKYLLDAIELWRQNSEKAREDPLTAQSFFHLYQECLARAAEARLLLEAEGRMTRPVKVRVSISLEGEEEKPQGLWIVTVDELRDYLKRQCDILEKSLNREEVLGYGQDL